MADSSDSDDGGMFCFSGTNNWPIWKEKMEDILYCKNLYLPLDGDSKKPDSATEEEWRVLNRQTCGTIRKWLDVSICHHVSGVTSASEMWSKLHELYEKKTVGNKSMMFCKLVNIKYKDGMSVSEHLNEFQSTVNQLAVMKIVLEEEVQAMLLLNTLPNSWDTLVLSVSNSTPGGKLTLPMVYSALLNEETKRKANGQKYQQSTPALSSQHSKYFVFGSTTSSLSTEFSFGQSISTSSAQSSKPTVFGSTAASSASMGLQFGQSAPTSGSQPSTRFVLGSSTTSPSTGFSFGQSAPASSSQKPTPSIFGSSPSPPVTFGASISPSPTQSVFGFGSGSPGNVPINEDSMANDTNRFAAPVVPTFGQPEVNPSSNFAFGSPSAPTGRPLGYQFGRQQNPSVPQSSPSPFQALGNVGFPGGSFSLGSGGGGDKSGRKFVKVNRNKTREN